MCLVKILHSIHSALRTPGASSRLLWCRVHVHAHPTTRGGGPAKIQRRIGSRKAVQNFGIQRKRVENRGKRMAPQVGLEPLPEIPTAETIVLKIVKNTRKTSVDAGFEDVSDLSLKAGKTCQVGGRQYKSSTFFGRENGVNASSQPNSPSAPDVRSSSRRRKHPKWMVPFWYQQTNRYVTFKSGRDHRRERRLWGRTASRWSWAASVSSQSGTSRGFSEKDSVHGRDDTDRKQVVWQPAAARERWLSLGNSLQRRIKGNDRERQGFAWHSSGTSHRRIECDVLHARLCVLKPDLQQ